MHKLKLCKYFNTPGKQTLWKQNTDYIETIQVFLIWMITLTSSAIKLLGWGSLVFISKNGRFISFRWTLLYKILLKLKWWPTDFIASTLNNPLLLRKW